MNSSLRYILETALESPVEGSLVTSIKCQWFHYKF